MDVIVVENALLSAAVGKLRDSRTDAEGFRSALSDISSMVILEAGRHEPVIEIPIMTPVSPAIGFELSNPPLLVPILRAGLGMLYAGLSLMPMAAVGFVGLSRNEETLIPSCYMVSLPESIVGRSTYILDPLLATGGSAAYTARLLAERGASHVTVVCALASPEGLSFIQNSGIPIERVVTANVDDRLNGVGFIVPGVGDAGDRQFGPV
ncbi:MAG TPA: uracil phosphoribosyltransferase [Pseudonocardiaceae bacterium]|nr:uracil phosphoribosyltransferase [Pseudonocardiaceae bacterium]